MFRGMIWSVSLGMIVATVALAGPWSWRREGSGKSVPRTAAVAYQTCCRAWSSSRMETAGSAVHKPLVWVVDGAGDLKGCSSALAYANAVAGNPLELAVFPWSHGYRRLLKDQIDGAHARRQGARLAEVIGEQRQRQPERRMVLVAHSAGCAVALGAGDVLPPDSLDRIILLAPSVSTGYNLRPTLLAAREGVDVFCSKRDWVALGFVVRVVGTTDNFWSGAAAGRWGFRQAQQAAQDPLIARRLRQHFWSPELAWTGHHGGHHGMHAPGFIHTFLMPLILGQ
jgi:hypothetical protein